VENTTAVFCLNNTERPAKPAGIAERSRPYFYGDHVTVTGDSRYCMYICDISGALTYGRWHKSSSSWPLFNSSSRESDLNGRAIKLARKLIASFFIPAKRSGKRRKREKEIYNPFIL